MSTPYTHYKNVSKNITILDIKPPVQRVFELYTPDNPRTFQNDLSLHLLHGYVFSTPEEFIMGRAVDSRADEEDIRNPSVIFDEDECDCWLIYAYATRYGSPENFRGLVEKVLRWMPYELPLVAWDRKRRNRMLFFSINKFKSWTTTNSPVR